MPVGSVFADLPEDLLQSIAAYLLPPLRFSQTPYVSQLVTEKDDLLAFCLLSKRFNHIASDLLWRRAGMWLDNRDHLASDHRPNLSLRIPGVCYFIAVPERMVGQVRLLSLEEVGHPGEDCSVHPGQHDSFTSTDMDVDEGVVADRPGNAFQCQLLAEDAYHARHYELDTYADEPWVAWCHQISRLPSLRALSISLFGPHNLFVVRRLAQLRHIQTLCLIGHHFEDWPLHGSCPNVTSLYLTACSLVQALDAMFPCLARLVVRGDADASLVLTSPLCIPWSTVRELELEEVSLDYHKWLVEDLEYFSEDHKHPLPLTKLNLNYARSTPRDPSERWPVNVDSLVRALENATNLRELALQNFVDVTPESVERLARVVPSLSALHISCASREETYSATVQDYAIALQALSHVEYLECNVFDLPTRLDVVSPISPSSSSIPPRLPHALETALNAAASTLTTHLPRLRDVRWCERGVPPLYSQRTVRMALRRGRRSDGGLVDLPVDGIEVEYCEKLSVEFNFVDSRSHPDL